MGFEIVARTFICTFGLLTLTTLANQPLLVIINPLHIYYKIQDMKGSFSRTTIRVK